MSLWDILDYESYFSKHDVIKSFSLREVTEDFDVSQAEREDSVKFAQETPAKVEDGALDDVETAVERGPLADLTTSKFA